MPPIVARRYSERFIVPPSAGAGFTFRVTHRDEFAQPVKTTEAYISGVAIGDNKITKRIKPLKITVPESILMRADQMIE
jgi:hypothetical protein